MEYKKLKRTGVKYELFDNVREIDEKWLILVLPQKKFYGISQRK